MVIESEDEELLGVLFEDYGAMMEWRSGALSSHFDFGMVASENNGWSNYFACLLYSRAQVE